MDKSLDPKGKTMLKVTGILYIIMGALASLGALAFVAITVLLPYSSEEIIKAIYDTLSSYNIIDNVSQATAIFSFLDSLMLYMGIIAIVIAILAIVTGVINIVNCSKPQNYKLCMVFNIIFLVMVVLVAASTMNFILLIISIVIPVIAIMGASFNKQSLKSLNNSGSRYM